MKIQIMQARGRGSGLWSRSHRPQGQGRRHQLRHPELRERARRPHEALATVQERWGRASHREWEMERECRKDTAVSRLLTKPTGGGGSRRSCRVRVH